MDWCVAAQMAETKEFTGSHRPNCGVLLRRGVLSNIKTRRDFAGA
jgi:hypothetical protein